MVTNATSLSRSGLSDWLIQRFSAVILAAYVLWLMGILLFAPPPDHTQWRALFAGTGMRLFGVIALASLCAHAWVGMWTIGTDYLTERHLGGAATPIRLLYQAICVLLIAVYLLWGIEVFWGN